MLRAAMLAAVALAAPARGEVVRLDWDAAAINRWHKQAAAAAKKGADTTVHLRVWVVAGSKASEQSFATQLMGANKVFNDADEGAALCGVRFKFAAPALRIELPDEWTELLDWRREKLDKRAENFYASPERLSRAEVALFEKLGKPRPGELNVVYLPSLGGARGYTYNKLPVWRMDRRDLPYSRPPREVFDRYQGTILLADTAHLYALAHELAHALTGPAHATTCDLAQIEKDHEGCLAMRSNILLEEGYGDHVTQAQCAALADGARKLKRR